jgi:YVTN family beta-propeller protein
LALDGEGVLYVSSESEDVVYAVTLADGQIALTIEVGARPGSLRIDRDQKRLYVANQNDNTVSIVDLTDTDVVRPVETHGQPLAISATSDRLYTVSPFDNLLSIIDPVSGLLGTVPVESRPWDVEVSPDGDTLYVASSGTSEIVIIAAAGLP